LNTRIKKLRKELVLTQQAFAERIGLKQNSIALIESGKRNISTQAILSICREFNVNEKWLRTGSGEMFVYIPEEDMYSKAAASILKENDALAMEALKLYFQMSPEVKKAVSDYILQLADMIRSRKEKEE